MRNTYPASPVKHLTPESRQGIT